MKRKLEVECMSLGDLSKMTITFYKCGCWIQTKERPSYTELMFMKFMKRLRLPHPRSRHRIILDSYLWQYHLAHFQILGHSHIPPPLSTVQVQ